MVLTPKSVDETIVCDHSNKSCQAVLYVLLFIMLYKAVLPFILSVDETLVYDH